MKPSTGSGWFTLLTSRMTHMKTVGVNARGYRIGQWNQFAKFSDRVVEQIRQLRDDGMTYPSIAEKMEMSKWTVADICRHRRRAEIPARFKKVEA